jgi:hypothetical protein
MKELAQERGSRAHGERTGERRIVFNPIVQVDILEIKSVFPVLLFEDTGHDVRDETTEGGREVERVANFGAHFREGDGSPISRQDTCALTIC